MGRQKTVGHIRTDAADGVFDGLQRTVDIVVVPRVILYHADEKGFAVLVVTDLTVLIPRQTLLDGRLIGRNRLVGFRLVGSRGRIQGNGVGDYAVLVECVGVVGRQKTVGHIRTDAADGVFDGLQRTVDIVVVPRVILYHADEKGFAILVVTDLAVLIPRQTLLDGRLTRGGQDGAEIHDGVADLTVGTAGVAVLGCGRLLILQCDGNRNIGGALSIVPMCLHTVIVTAIPIGVPCFVTDVVRARGAYGGSGVSAQLGIHLHGGACEGSGGAIGKEHGAAIGLHADIHGQDIVGALVIGIHPDLTGVVSLGRDGFQLPGTNGDGDQGGLARQIRLTDPLNGQRSNILVSHKGIGGGKAAGHDHMVQMPRADAVQIQRHGDGIHPLNSSRDHVHVVERAQQNAVSGRIVSYDLHRGVIGRIDGDLTDNRREISRLVANGESHKVAAVCQRHTV